jgi:hypothetical protein|tara:strand:+ start:195 stop:383 length:189 start_codon:yes stop_codon:yes gene_type:complete
MIKKLIEKIFGKFCKCEKPIILKDEVKQEEAKEVIATEPEKILCNTHSRFKKSCPICNEAAK